MQCQRHELAQCQVPGSNLQQCHLVEAKLRPQLVPNDATKHQTCHAKIGDGYQTVEPSQWSKRSQMANAQGDQLRGSVSHGSLFGLLVGISGNENQFVELRLFKV